jgi:hypothetical protein
MATPSAYTDYETRPLKQTNSYANGVKQHIIRDREENNLSTMRRGLRSRDLLARRQFLKSLNTLPIQKKMHVLKHLDEKSLQFLAECFKNIVDGEGSLLRLSKPHRELAQKHWRPYMPMLEKMSQKDKIPQIARQVRKQTGEGLLMAALISAAIPIITDLIKGLANKQNRRKIVT